MGIYLGNATTTITATLSGAVSTNQVMVQVFYEDEPSTTTGGRRGHPRQAADA